MGMAVVLARAAERDNPVAQMETGAVRRSLAVRSDGVCLQRKWCLSEGVK